jgi:hypothetical protein
MGPRVKPEGDGVECGIGVNAPVKCVNPVGSSLRVREEWAVVPGWV